jgi:predicted esterase
MVEDWVKTNLDVSSPVTEVIAQNNTVAQQGTDGAWVNSMPVYMIHSRGDKLVPYGNSQDAKGWLVGGNGAPVSLRTVSPHGWNPDHGPAAPFALVGGIYWLANGCKE